MYIRYPMCVCVCIYIYTHTHTYMYACDSFQCLITYYLLYVPPRADFNNGMHWKPNGTNEAENVIVFLPGHLLPYRKESRRRSDRLDANSSDRQQKSVLPIFPRWLFFSRALSLHVALHRSVCPSTRPSFHASFPPSSFPPFLPPAPCPSRHRNHPTQNIIFGLYIFTFIYIFTYIIHNT